jgi:hypothetical protein
MYKIYGPNFSSSTCFDTVSEHVHQSPVSFYNAKMYARKWIGYGDVTRWNVFRRDVVGVIKLI